MNRTLWFFIIIVVSLAVVSCGYPFGYIHDDSETGLDDFWVVPQRQYYTLGDSFVRAKDMCAFTSSQGLVKSIPADKVEINLFRKPSDEEPDPPPIPIVKGQYKLDEGEVGTGSKLIIVTYGGKTDEYWIEIRDLHGNVDPDDQGSGEGSGIGINWR